MNRLVVILGGMLLGMGVPVRAADVIDGVIAIVNDKVITYSEVMMLVQPVDRELRRNYSGQELEDQRRKAQVDALNALIEHALIVQEFDAKGYKIPETYVDGQINSRIATEFGGNRAAFIKTLEAENLTLSQFRDQERERIIIEAMRDQRARKTMVVSPYKIEKYYQDNTDQFKVGDQVKVRMIFIKRGPAVSAGALAATADSAWPTNQALPVNSEAATVATNTEATTGGSTTAVAEAATTATNTAEAGPTNSATPVAVSTTGTVEAATSTTNAVEVAETNGSPTVAAAAAPAQPPVDLQRKLADEILAKLDDGDSFENMARDYSEGKEAKEGGDWGWVGRDLLRKELNEVAFSLKPRQHSHVIETTEGYYILEVDDVKPAHTTPLAEVRDDIEKTLLQQQRALMHEDWVKDLRAKAYIHLF